MKKTFNEIPISKLDCLNTKKFEKQIQNLYESRNILVGTTMQAAFENPLIKKTLYPSACKNLMYFKINDVKYYFHLSDFYDRLRMKIFKLDPCNTETAKEIIKKQISNLLKEL